MPTRYTVTETEDARDRLVLLWLGADTYLRAEITRASALIDRELKDDADQKGDPLPQLGPGRRQITVAPLRAYFVVSEPDRMVTIRDYELDLPTP